MSTLAQGTRAMLAVLSGATGGSFTIHVRHREGDRLEKYSTQEITLDKSGPYSVITGDMGTVSRMLAEAMDALDGGYLVLAWKVPVEPETSMTWAWRVLAGSLIPLKGAETNDLFLNHLGYQVGLRTSERVVYGDAWAAT